MKAKLIAVAAAGAALLCTGAAHAAVTLEFNPSWGGAPGNTGATAVGVFTFTDFGDDVRMELLLSNTTDGSVGLGATEATLVGIAFDLPTFSDITYDSNGTEFSKLWSNPDFPPFTSHGIVFDLGISLDRNQFVGGPANDGLKAGQSLGSVFFTIDTTLDAAAFEAAFLAGHLANGGLDAAARFQQVNAPGGSDKVLGGAPPPPNNPPTYVPEPATWALMILGFGAAGAMLRRRALTGTA